MAKVLIVLLLAVAFTYAALNSAADFCRTASGYDCNNEGRAVAATLEHDEETEEVPVQRYYNEASARPHEVCIIFFYNHF